MNKHVPGVKDFTCRARVDVCLSSLGWRIGHELIHCPPLRLSMLSFTECLEKDVDGVRFTMDTVELMESVQNGYLYQRSFAILAISEFSKLSRPIDLVVDWREAMQS
mmetsp:Transcript_21319/g.70673  ORF Transcript_21319/g.70673 Transcript_21319/m.70673 type:complete len:107 (+) Transcript_21319:211-531(+)